MDRRDFVKKSGCGLACFMAAPILGNTLEGAQSRRYKIEIEIFEARTDTWCHKKGDKFNYPGDVGKICPWLMSSMNDFITALKFGGELNWKYEGTPYEKVIDKDGITTEYVRCPDPTANLVAKITRTKIG